MALDKEFTSLETGDYIPPVLIPTRIRNLDRALDGGVPSNKIALFAARTSHGKSALTVRLAYNMAMDGRPVVVVWCEDDVAEFNIRLLALATKIPRREVFAHYCAMTMHEVMAKIPPRTRDKLEKIRVYPMSERPTVDEVCDLFPLMGLRGSVFIIDHLGEFNWGAGLKHEAMGNGFRKLRAAANKAGSLVIAMHQLNREWDKRKGVSQSPDDVRPVLSDIEASGQLEQAARVCVIMERMPNKTDFLFNVFKPRELKATCKWNEDLCTMEDPPPVPVGEAVQTDLKIAK